MARGTDRWRADDRIRRLHVGTCKVMYDEYAFGPGRLRRDDPGLEPWPKGEAKETRWPIKTLLEHDTYHAGEINHIRSLLATDDGWRWG